MYEKQLTVENAQYILNDEDGDYYVKRALREHLLPAMETLSNIAENKQLHPTLVPILLGRIFLLWSRFDYVPLCSTSKSADRFDYSDTTKCNAAFIAFIEKLSADIGLYDQNNNNNNMEDTLLNSPEYIAFRDTLKNTSFRRSSGKVGLDAFQQDLLTGIIHTVQQNLLGGFFSSYRRPLQKWETYLGSYEDFVQNETKLLKNIKESVSELLNVDLNPVKSARC